MQQSTIDHQVGGALNVVSFISKLLKAYRAIWSIQLVFFSCVQWSKNTAGWQMANMSTMVIDYSCVFQAFLCILPTLPHKVDDQQATMNMRMSPIC